MTRALVVAVALLAAAAAADAVRQSGAAGGGAERAGDGRARGAEVIGRRYGAPPASLRAAEFSTAGRRVADHVLRRGSEYLGRKAIEEAFPGDAGGPIEIGRVAVARDEIVALGVYRRLRGGPARAAVQVWRERRLLGAFTVPTGSFGGGLVLSADGAVVVLFSHDRALRGVFDHQGRRLGELPLSFFIQ